MTENQPRPTLGVVTISWNEERDLPGFLANLVGWVDEIVIVDDGSTDKTIEIARDAGPKVKFLESSRRDGEYFSHQRNKGIDTATSDWLLHMDVDERVPAALRDEALKAIADERYDAYRYRRLNFFLHRAMLGGGWQDWNLVHLAKRDKFRFGGMYHEDCHVNTSEERVGQLKNKMWHLNDETYAERMRKSNLYCQEEAENLERRDLIIKWWHFFQLPVIEFVKKYFVKGGFRDGTVGLLFSLHSTTAKFKACALLWDKQNKLPREAIEEKLRAEDKQF